MDDKTKEDIIKGCFEDIKKQVYWIPKTKETEILDLPIWNLTKCYDRGIINGLQINYGNKNITILISDDLYLELEKLTKTPKEEEHE